ncbi:MAG TPA: uracil-DNA glycosylase [Pyrinomonadaceae bacterium]|jgi:DNA polymerase
MRDETQAQDFHALVAEVKEHLSYLRELGIEGFEEAASVESQNIEKPLAAPARGAAEVGARTPALDASLKRNALAAEAFENAKAREAAAPVSSSSGEDVPPPSRGDTTNMAKRSVKKTPELETPAPMETLFGVITPKDEASLPRLDETLEDIWNDIGECTRCPLSESRTHVVNSEGNRHAQLMFVGEAPGANEDEQARPFVGRAGQLLNKIIEAIGLKREDVFIGNVNRCRPPQNRTPTLAEAATCKPFLLREIAIVQPKVIVVLGNTAMKNLLDTKEGITKLRGQFQDYKGIKVMPTFHPAYLLRDPSKKRETWEDMKKVRDYLNSVRDE